MKKILIVEDHADIRKLLKMTLEFDDFEIHEASTGDAGLALCREICPDIVLLDIMMPGMDGVEVCMQLRQLPEFKNMVITFLTARGEDYSQIAGF